LQVAAVKIVDDILFTGSEEHVRSIIDHIRSKYQLGTVLYGPGTFLFFGLTICQDTDFSVTVHGDCKLNALEAFPIDRNRRKQIDTPLNDIELQAFRSVNSSIGWLGIAASPFCSLYASYLQRKAPMPLVRDLVCQINSIWTLKKLGTTIRFKRPPGQDEYKISVLIFSDASRPCDYGQLGYVAGLLIGEFGSGSVFHTLSWTSHKSKRPVKSIGADEILAAGEAIDEGKFCSRPMKPCSKFKWIIWWQWILRIYSLHFLLVATRQKDPFALVVGWAGQSKPQTKTQTERPCSVYDSRDRPRGVGS